MQATAGCEAIRSSAHVASAVGLLVHVSTLNKTARAAKVLIASDTRPLRARGGKLASAPVTRASLPPPIFVAPISPRVDST